ncbi:MAG: glycosylase, partial [Bacilli bacterium]|nr:glycosylase [Bacilli bacterium]
MKINIPWQEKPENFKGPIWRYTNNPIIDRNTNDELTRVFNSSIVIFNGEYIGIFRAEAADNIPHIFLGRSKDGVNFDIETEP